MQEGLASWIGPCLILAPQESIVGPARHHLLFDHLCAKLIEDYVEYEGPRLGHHDAEVDQGRKERPMYDRLIFL